MEKLYWFVAQTYVNKVGASVSFFAFRDDSYGLYTTTDINDENICYYSTEASAKRFAYESVANTDRTVHGKYLLAPPRRLIAD